MKKYCFLFIIFVGFITPAVWAQSSVEKFKQAENLRLNYEFEKAAAIFSDIAATDSLLAKQATRQLLFCENGKTLLDYIEKPTVTGKIIVPKNKFFGYYNFDFGGTWAVLPDSVLQAGQRDDALSPVFVPEKNPTAFYFSSPMSGNWNIYVMRRVEGNQWTSPLALDSIINTPFDERFPYVTPDGKTLYFSSNGHSGMGGYDLYKSTFNETTQQWRAPENLGFPYSSPCDDWLFVPSVDQTTALFASSRNAITDSLEIYRITLEANPIKQSGRRLQEIQQIAQLSPEINKKKTDKPVQDEQSDSYVALRKVLLQQQKDEQLLQNKLTNARNAYVATSSNDERMVLQTEILEYEQLLMQMQTTINQVAQEVRQAEQKLLEKGIIPDINLKNIEIESVDNSAPFEILYRKPIAFPTLNILPPPEEIISESEYVFRVGKTSAIFYNQSLPKGLVYRVQIGKFSRRLPETELKGLSPAFIYPENKLFIHYIGHFATYNEVSKALPEIKKRGFRDAIIVAFLDGTKTTTQLARNYETKKKINPEINSPQTATKIVLGEFPKGLPQALRQAVQAATENDIVRATENGRTIYIVGPFASATDAQKVQEYLKANGFETTIE